MKELQLLRSNTAFSKEKQTLEKNLPHAVLVCGGGAVLSRAFVMDIVATNCCVNKTGCYDCEVCNMISEFNYPDLRFFPQENEGKKAGSRKWSVTDIKELIFQASLKPSVGERKYFVLAGCDEMSVDVQNKLLKTLEEPSSDNVFFLLTQNPNKILPTVKSRCQIVKLPSITAEDTVQYLLENGVTQRQAEVLAGVTFCSPFDAERLFEQGMSEHIEKAFDILPKFRTSKDILLVSSTLEQCHKKGVDIASVLTFFFRELISAKSNIQLLLAKSRKDVILAASEQYSLAALAQILQEIAPIRGKLENNASFFVVCDGLLLAIAEVKHRCQKL